MIYEEEKPDVAEIKVNIPVEIVITYPKSKIDGLLVGTIEARTADGKQAASRHFYVYELEDSPALIYEYESRYFFQRPNMERKITDRMVELVNRRIASGNH